MHLANLQNEWTECMGSIETALRSVTNIIAVGSAISFVGCQPPADVPFDEPCPEDNPFCHSFDGKRWTDEKQNLTFEQASELCEQLKGTLPGISEHRALFVDCPDVAPGGSCGVTNECTTAACMTEGCISCGDGHLNVFGSENIFWSNTARSDSPGEHFVAVYRYGYITSFSDTESFSAYCYIPF